MYIVNENCRPSRQSVTTKIREMCLSR